MTDSEDSTVTYTAVSSPFGGLSDIGSPGVVRPEYEGLPWMLDDPYVQPVYPEFMQPEDEILPAEEQPLPATDSPTADSPDYIPEGDDGDDEDEPSDDDEDEEVNIEADDEEGEHPVHADSTAVALLAVEHAPSAEETELFETDESAAAPPPHLAYRITSRISIRDETPISLPPREEVERLLAMPTPPSSPLSPWSSPLPQISSPPLPVSSLVPVLSPSPPASPIRLLGYRAAMIRLRAEAASTSHSLPLPPLSPIPAPTPSPPLLLPSTNRREDRPESSSATAARPTGGLRANYGFVATMDREIRHDLERDVGYGITDSWDEIVEAMQGTLVVTDVAEFSQRMTEFETRVRQDTNEIYTRLDDEQSERQLMAGQLNMLYRDRRAHARTARLMKTEARIATCSKPQEADDDYKDVGGRSQEAEAVHRGTKAAEETSDLDDRVRETAGTR
ncbi:hypothetical protein Tco_0906913 [Tanacetum coccineum]|uniref:GLTSCR protein conserved domain-containing protein n=1 Tax=Tanacetum coccineum TaxID=301880 RepID=A0ABQ5CL37_9ASTR